VRASREMGYPSHQRVHDGSRTGRARLSRARRAADTKGSGALGTDTPYLEAQGEGWVWGTGMTAKRRALSPLVKPTRIVEQAFAP